MTGVKDYRFFPVNLIIILIIVLFYCRLTSYMAFPIQLVVNLNQSQTFLLGIGKGSWKMTISSCWQSLSRKKLERRCTKKSQSSKQPYKFLPRWYLNCRTSVTPHRLLKSYERFCHLDIYHPKSRQVGYSSFKFSDLNINFWSISCGERSYTRFI